MRIGNEAVVDQTPGGTCSSREVSASAVAIGFISSPYSRLYGDQPCQMPLTGRLQVAHNRQYGRRTRVRLSCAPMGSLYLNRSFRLLSGQICTDPASPLRMA